MKKIIKNVSISISLIVSVFFLSNLNSTNIVNNDFDLASLTTVNVANAEQTEECYGSYTTGGNWVIVKCTGCVQQAHVDKREQKSTCTH